MGWLCHTVATREMDKKLLRTEKSLRARFPSAALQVAPKKLLNAYKMAIALRELRYATLHTVSYSVFLLGFIDRQTKKNIKHRYFSSCVAVLRVVPIYGMGSITTSEMVTTTFLSINPKTWKSVCLSHCHIQLIDSALVREIAFHVTWCYYYFPVKYFLCFFYAHSHFTTCAMSLFLKLIYRLIKNRGFVF